MIHGANTMKRIVALPSPTRIIQKSVEAIRQARARSPFSRSSLKTGTNAEESAASATSAAHGVRDQEGDLERVDGATDAEVISATISRASPSTRESPVAPAKIAVDQARRLGGGGSPGAARSGSSTGPSIGQRPEAAVSGRILRPRDAGVSPYAEHQSAKAPREIPPASGTRTCAIARRRRLSSSASSRLWPRATRTALQRSTASSSSFSTRPRRSARSTRTRPRARSPRPPGSSPASPPSPGPAPRGGDFEQRSLELELVRDPARTLEGRVQLREPDDRRIELVA